MKRIRPLALVLSVLALSLAACGVPAAANVGSTTGSSQLQLLSPLTSFISRIMDAAQGTTTAAIRDVIQRGNQEQQDAFAQNNPALMQDTATADYYNQLTQINQNMRDSGVTSIQLLRLRWGRIRSAGSGQWQATTLETWRTIYSDGTIDESTDLNVYTLVQQNGAWKIQADQHPDTEIQIPNPLPGVQPVPGNQPVPPLRISPGSDQSLNWAGYQATGGTFTSVSGTWTVPQVSGTNFGADATWVGIGGVAARDLIQAGTEATLVGPGQVQYQAWIETLPQASRPVPLSINPGDSITVSVTQQSAGQWQMSFKDNTTGQSYRQALAYNSSGSSAEWVEEAPSSMGGLLPLDNFGTVHFTGATAVKSGQTVSVAAAGGQPITMINRLGQAIVSPSPLAADGSSFTVTRAAAAQSTPGIGFITLPF